MRLNTARIFLQRIKKTSAFQTVLAIWDKLSKLNATALKLEHEKLCELI